MKNWILGIAALFLLSCNTPAEETSESGYFQIVGEAQGTTYGITFKGNNLDPNVVKSSVDSILAAYDEQNSIYKSSSLISQINESDDSLFSLKTSTLEDAKYFTLCFEVAKEIHQLTSGAFNPAVYPLVNYWGFHKENFNYEPDSTEVADLVALIDFSNENFRLEGDHIFRANTGAKIDFNALAQGHSVDVVADYLESLGLKDYMVEIGGEITCSGKNPSHKLWTVGIDKPVDESSPGENGFQFIAAFTNKSLATSGNYRKFYEIDGQKYSHTIDPVTGYPAEQNLLSVTVVTDECVYADAYATAFMVMGLEKSLMFIENHPELSLHAYFVYDENGELNTQMTTGFEQFILE